MAELTADYDVIVAGGGLAGVAAAVAAARSGASVLLVDRFPCLGGAATMRNVITFCGLFTLADPPRRVAYGIAKEITDGMWARGAVTPPIRHRGVYQVFDPESLKSVLDEITATAGVTVLTGVFIADAQQTDGQLTTITIASHSGLSSLSARAFVDCTGEGDLAAFAGAGTRYGNDGAVNLGTLGTRFSGIPADVVVTADDVAAAVATIAAERGHKIEAAGFTKDRSVVARLPISNDLVIYVASARYDARDAADMAAAEVSGRDQSWSYLEALRRIPGCAAAYLVSTGPEFGTRESRHLTCCYQLRWDDVQDRRRFDDAIGLGGWGAEWHDRDTYASTFDFAPDKGAYEIPMSCLESADIANLFCAGRLADGDRKAGAAIRVMGTAMVTGQAAGVAAALTARGCYDRTELQAVLRAQGAVLTQSDLDAI